MDPEMTFVPAEGSKRFPASTSQQREPSAELPGAEESSAAPSNVLTPEDALEIGPQLPEDAVLEVQPGDVSDERADDSGGGDGAMGEDTDGGETSMEIEQDAQPLDDDANNVSIDSTLSEGNVGAGKRVKVYELRESSWFDRGTGFCKGVYDDTQDLALIIVEAEETPAKETSEDGPASGQEGQSAEDGPGGFFKEELLLNHKVDKGDIYQRQQDTLIVWTEPSTGQYIALSFQDAEGCEDIWTFISEVQKHLSMMAEVESQPLVGSSSPIAPGGPLGVGVENGEARATWQPPTLANIKDQEMWIRMQTKSPQARERAVEHILNEHYIRHLVNVFKQAEDLESVEDLHAICSLMQTILLFNDNSIFEYIMQDDIFLPVVGMLEYDPEYPSLKASYRDFFTENVKFREVVTIRDAGIRQKIHQTYRLQYMKDVVLARMLDDPTFGILNGFIFFNQVDIVNYIHTNDALLGELFETFNSPASDKGKDRAADPSDPSWDERKRDLVRFTHHLILAAKQVQMQTRMNLYRTLLDRGLLALVAWAFTREEGQVLHAAAETLMIVVEHDVQHARGHILKQKDANKPSVLAKVIEWATTTANIGLLSQVMDTIRTLLETGTDGDSFMAQQKRDSPITESFIAYFYDQCISPLFQPLLDLPDIRPSTDPPPSLPRPRKALLQNLVELLSVSITNPMQQQRASYFILTHTISTKIASLLYLRDKPLRHVALRYIRKCLQSSNHYIHRYFVKNDLLGPVVYVMEIETRRDNMLSSACMDVLDLIRKENIKPIINYLLDTYGPRLEALGKRPVLSPFIAGIFTRGEQNNATPPPPNFIDSDAARAMARATRAAEAEEEDYFNASDDEDVKPPTSTAVKAAANASPSSKVPNKRKKADQAGGPHKRSNSGAGGAAGSYTPRVVRGNGVIAVTGPNYDHSKVGAGLVDYDDNSDSDSSTGGQSPRLKPQSPSAGSSSPKLSASASTSAPASDPKARPAEELEEEMGDVTMKMRAKRQREEEEEEGFAGMLVKGTVGGGKAKRSPSPSAVQKDKDKDKEREKGGAKKEGGGTPAKKGGIRVNLFGIGKKFGAKEEGN